MSPGATPGRTPHLKNCAHISVNLLGAHPKGNSLEHMVRTSFTLGAIIALLALGGSNEAWSRDGHRLLIPMRSRLSPVQRLNREGVDAVKHHKYDQAEALFNKAYLYDPADPFTLNNLGYISEVQGQLDR